MEGKEKVVERPSTSKGKEKPGLPKKDLKGKATEKGKAKDK